MCMNEDFTRGLKKFTKTADGAEIVSKLGDEIPKELEVSAQEKSTPEVQSFEDWREDLYKGKDSKIFPELARVDEEGKREDTPAEAREELRKTVEEAVVQLEDSEGDERKKQEGAKTSEENAAYLAEHSEKQKAEAENKGGVIEKYFRKMGEEYNKSGWKSKLGLGVALGLGTAAFATVSVPAAFVCLGGLAAQRAAGTASMFLKFEKYKKFENHKELAVLMAGLYGVATGFAIKEAVSFLSETPLGDITHEWLKHNWPFGHAEIAKAPIAPEQPAAAASVGESAASVPPAPEIPPINVEASPGHGYEYMLKRLWEQLHDNKQLDPSKYAEGSDIHKLLTADAASIDTVVHQIASDSGHGFFNADGTSVQINLDDHIFIAPDGQVHMSHEFYNSGPVQAPENAPVTPAYPPETAPAAPEITPPVGEAATDHLSNKIYSEGSNPSVLHGSADYPLESHTPPIEEFQPDKVTFSHDEVHTRIFPEDGNQEREVLESIKTYADDYTELTVSEDGRILERFMVDPEGHTSRYTGGDTFVPASEDQTADVKNAIEHAHRDEISAPQPEAPAHAQEIIQQSGSGEVIQEHADGIVVNQSGLKIPTDKPHFYAGADDKHIFAYGGGSAEEKLKAIKEFLTQNLDKTVYSADANGEHRIPWHITPQGELVGVPEKTGGIFGWFKSFVKPPEPNEFVKLIK